MAGQDINIKITTAADTTGAKEAEKALQKVEAQAKETAMAETGFGGQVDPTRSATIREETAALAEKTVAVTTSSEAVANATEKTAEWSRTWYETSEATKKAGTSLDQLGSKIDATKLKQIAAATGHGEAAAAIEKFAGTVGGSAAVIVAEMAAIATAAAVSYDAVSKTISGYGDAIAEAKTAGVQIGPEFEAEINAWKETLAPIEKSIKLIGEAWDDLRKAVSNPVDFFSGLGEFREWSKEHLALIAFTTKAQADFIAKRAEGNQSGLRATFEAENEELRKQLTLAEQINAAREAADNIALARARNAVTIAKQDGGDVGAAEGNVVLVQLQSTLRNLQTGIKNAQADVEKATEAVGQQKKLLNQAVYDGLPKEEIAKIKQNQLAAENALEIANNALQNQSNLFKDKAALAGENAEIALVDLQDKYAGATTAEAKKVFDAVQAELQKVSDIGSGQIIEQVDQVKTQIVTDQTATTDAVKSVAETSVQSTQKAAAETAKSIGELSAAYVAGFTQILAVVDASKREITTLKFQVSQLLSR